MSLCRACYYFNTKKVRKCKFTNDIHKCTLERGKPASIINLKLWTFYVHTIYTLQNKTITNLYYKIVHLVLSDIQLRYSTASTFR